MALLKDMYNLTKYVDETKGTNRQLQYGSSGMEEAWQEYGQIKSIPKKDAINIGEAASGEHFVKPLAINNTNTYKVVLDTQGIYLLDRTILSIVPKGLLLAWAEKNSKLINILWLAIGVAIAHIDDIIKVVNGWIP